MSTFRPFLQFYIFASDSDRKSFSKRQLKDWLDFRGRFLKFSTYLFRCVNMPREKWMIKLHLSSLNFIVILMTLAALREFFLQRQSILTD